MNFSRALRVDAVWASPMIFNRTRFRRRPSNSPQEICSHVLKSSLPCVGATTASRSTIYSFINASALPSPVSLCRYCSPAHGAPASPATDPYRVRAGFVIMCELRRRDMQRIYQPFTITAIFCRPHWFICSPGQGWGSNPLDGCLAKGTTGRHLRGVLHSMQGPVEPLLVGLWSSCTRIARIRPTNAERFLPKKAKEKETKACPSHACFVWRSCSFNLLY